MRQHTKEGDVFGRLTVLRRAGYRQYASGKAVVWMCRCECGAEKEFVASNLTKGDAQSCGCLHVEQLVERSTKHGLCHTDMYHVWLMIVQRCTNPRNKDWKHYGGRGITIDPRWRDFAVFAAEAGPGYATGLTIDRIENDEGYKPGNTRWATRAVQANNRRKKQVPTTS